MLEINLKTSKREQKAQQRSRNSTKKVIKGIIPSWKPWVSCNWAWNDECWTDLKTKGKLLGKYWVSQKEKLIANW